MDLQFNFYKKKKKAIPEKNSVFVSSIYMWGKFLLRKKSLEFTYRVLLYSIKNK